MSYQHLRSVSLPLITPFHDFSLRTYALYDSDLAVNIRRWDSGHEIERALDRLYDVVQRTEAIDGIKGPFKPWNVPSSSSSSGSARHRRLSRPASPYTPPRTPDGNSLTATMTSIAESHDLRLRLEKPDTRIAAMRTELADAQACLIDTEKELQELNSVLFARNSTIADLRETIARQHQQLSRQEALLSPVNPGRTSSSRHSSERSPPTTNSAGRPKPEKDHQKSARELDLATIRSSLRRGRYLEAERRARRVSEDCLNEKQLNSKSSQRDNREAQTLLCTALKKSGSLPSVEEALRLHASHCKSTGSREAMRSLRIDDRNWEFTNALELAGGLAAAGKYKAAVWKLEECLRVSDVVASEAREKLVSVGVEVIRLCLDDRRVGSERPMGPSA